MQQEANVTPVRILWTSGWDSTFQLLRLLLVHGKSVEPYYLRDDRRHSTRVEVDSMDRIRAALAQRHPHTRALLQPTRYFDKATLAPDAAIAEAFRRTRAQHFLGPQYEWLARFCRQHAIDDIELCVHRDDKAHAVLAPYVVEREVDGYRTHRFDPRSGVADLKTLFGHFSFPLFEVTKLEMGEEANARGWQDLMDMTWFCHSPRRDGRPCGICNPCLYTIEEGFAHRLPRSSLMRSAVFRTVVVPLKAPVAAGLQALGLRRWQRSG